MKLQGATLEVGLQSGGLALYDVGTKQSTMYIKGEGIAPAADVTMLGNHPWWVLDGTQFVRTAIPGITRPIDIDLSSSGLVGPIRRLSVWQEMIVAHADNGIRFIEPQTQQVMTPEQVLPPDVATLANQGVVTTSWKDGAGPLCGYPTLRSSQQPQARGSQRAWHVHRWSAPWRGSYKLLGSYTCDLVDFKDAPGPDVPRERAQRPDDASPRHRPYRKHPGQPGRIVALNNEEALTIPFYKDNWITQRVTTALPPITPSDAVSDDDMWWVKDGKLVRASLEDGSSEVFVPRSADQVLDIAADEDESLGPQLFGDRAHFR